MLDPDKKENQSFVEEIIPKTIARFGPTLNFQGELCSSEDLIIEGQFQGKINMENNNLTIGLKAEVNADIHVKNITIKGLVEGNIFANGKIFIEKDGQMIGDISASRISIMDGAQFKGSVKMVSHINYPSLTVENELSS